MMKKYLISFLAGLLSIGVGAGVCFAEFMQFEYGGEKILAIKNSANSYTTTSEFTLESDADITIRSDFDYGIKGTPRINVGADPLLKTNQVRIEADNNGNEFNFSVYQRGDEKGGSIISLGAYYYDNFQTFRQRMEDSKEHRYYDYIMDISDCEVQIYVHPDQISQIKMQINTEERSYS